MKAHIFRELVNDLRDIATQWHGSQQLRERISRRLSQDVSINKDPANDGWMLIETAPKDKFVLLCGPSGYTTTPLVFTTGIMRSNYHAGRWIDHADDDLMDWGFEPTHWMPLPTSPES